MAFELISVEKRRYKPPLSYFETAALAENDIISRHPHVIKVDLGMPVGCIIVAKHTKATDS